MRPFLPCQFSFYGCSDRKTIPSSLATSPFSKSSSISFNSSSEYSGSSKAGAFSGGGVASAGSVLAAAPLSSVVAGASPSAASSSSSSLHRGKYNQPKGRETNRYNVLDIVKLKFGLVACQDLQTSILLS